MNSTLSVIYGFFELPLFRFINRSTFKTNMSGVPSADHYDTKSKYSKIKDLNVSSIIGISYISNRSKWEVNVNVMATENNLST